MAVINELIDAGLLLKQQGNLKGAIEHFRQLHATYPGHARIMFELAGVWRAFGVPEQALPLYRELLAMPKNQGLPPKNVPRLYTQLGATLLTMGDYDESLAIIDEGLRLHPSYRPLRAWRIFALTSDGSHQLALLHAMDLMLESLAPSRWDIFEHDIKSVVGNMRAGSTADYGPVDAVERSETPSESDAEAIEDGTELTAFDESGAVTDESESSQRNDIAISDEAAEADDYDVAVNLVQPAKKRQQSRHKKKPRSQMGSKAVRIDIGSAGEEASENPDDDEATAQGGPLKIPIDVD